MAGQDKFEPENRNEDPMDYNFLTNTSMGMIPTANPMSVCKGDLLESSSCSSASMVDSFCPIIWDQTTNAQNLAFCDINMQNNAGTSSTLGFRKAGFGPPRIGIERTVDMGWTPPNSLLKGGMFVPITAGMLPQSLSHFPADSGFIERAARFSCFSGGNFGDMMNPFGLPESASPYSRGVAPMQGSHKVFGGSGLKSLSGEQSQKNEMNMAEGCKDNSLSAERGATGGSPLDNEKKGESFVRSRDEAKQGVGVSGNESGEAEFSGGGRGGGGGGGQEEQSLFEGTDRETSAKGCSSNKRKRSGQDTELDQVKGTPQSPLEVTKDSTEIQQKGDQNLTSIANRPNGKHGKQGSDSVKEDYIHIRARRGQATNSHSLAERVRREKISERMKFLQDLVPGCSKVTGKAVMLDEIINYVQSLQRQVEFLSMKLATVNPRLDFNIEGLLAKDILHSQAGSSSAHGFHQDMTMPYPQLHPSQSGLIPSTGNYSNALRRTISSQLTAMSGGYKEPTSQVRNVWEDELHNVIQLMGFNTSAPLNTQDLSGSLPSGHMKAEP